MEQADVPLRADRLEELQQRTRALGKLEPEQPLVLEAVGVPADHVARVQLGHLVVADVEHPVAVGGHRREQLLLLAPAAVQREADEDPRRRRIVVAVVELRDAATPEQPAEAQEAAGLLGNLHREQRLALGADVGPLGHVPQPVEVHVGAAVQRDQRALAALLARDVLLDAGDRERAGRFRDRAVVLEDVLDRGADLVGGDQQHLVHVLTCETEGLLADAPHRDAVREDADALERHALPGLQRLVHAGRVLGLDADDPDARIERFHVGRDACDQAAAADRHEDRVDRSRVLAQDLHADRALTRDHVRVIEGMDQRQVPLPRELDRMVVGVVEVVAVQHDLATEVEHRLHLDARRGLRHHDDRRYAAPPARQRHALRVVASGGADDAPSRHRVRQVRDLVVRAAQLEREDRLQVLALEQDAVVQPTRQPRRFLERRFDRDLVDTGFQDPFDVAFLHGHSAGTGG